MECLILMAKIKGMTVTLIDKTIVGHDTFDNPIYEETETHVKNVLVNPLSSEDIINTQNLTGRTAVYTLAIPKGDINEWENKEVIFFNQRWRVFGITLQGIDDLIPLKWNKKVTVERYD